jgi:NADPH:quinone reductase-like Zn-dependent oxidoreductase
MKAVVYDEYGPPEVLQLREILDPQVGDGDVLIRVRAASANPLDWFAFTGTPYIARPGFGLKKPRGERLGADLAGVVEKVGSAVTTMKPSDEVFGTSKGTFAELVVAAEGKSIAPKPANLSFEEAAAIPVAALTALQALRDKGSVQPGHRVLVNGAAGGVGSFTVQIAKALGAEVTAVCSSRNVDVVRSLGADEVIDYTREDFTRGVAAYDLMIDVAGSRTWSEVKRVLRPNATVVIVGGSKTSRMLGPLGHMIRMTAGSMLDRQKTTFFISKENVADLMVLAEMAERGTIRPFVEQTYPLDRISEAMTYLGTGHARGKLVIVPAR